MLGRSLFICWPVTYAVSRTRTYATFHCCSHIDVHASSPALASISPSVTDNKIVMRQCVCLSVCGHSNGCISCKATKVRTSSLRLISHHPFPYFPTKGPQFWGLNRRFQAKLAKSKNVHIIKTTASISTTFCTVIVMIVFRTVSNFPYIYDDRGHVN